MKNISLKILSILFVALVLKLDTIAISNPKNIATNPTTAAIKDSNIVSDSTYEKAINEFKNLGKAEKKMRAKDAKKLLKEYKKQKKNGGDVKTDEILLAILCVLLPPLAVYLHQGKEANNKFWLSLVLTLLFWVPGVIYALLVVFFEF